MNKYIFLTISCLIIFLTYYFTAFFSFIIFVPLFYLLSRERSFRLMLVIYFYFFLFNFITTYWLAYVQLKEGLLTWGVNSLFMLTVVILTFYIEKKNKNVILIFISFWLSFELIHHLWDFNWPWLSLGNIFCTNIKFIQWYKYTGVEGGTAWLLLINFFIFKFFNSKAKKLLLIVFLIITIPLSISLYLFNIISNSKENYNVIITQPNLNTLNSNQNEIQIMHRIYDSVDKLKIAIPTVLLLPETFIKENVFNSRLQDNRAIQEINNRIKVNGNISCLTGIIVKKIKNETFEFSKNAKNSFELFDAAILLSKNYAPQLHFKSKLIPIEEYLPTYLNGLGFISDDFSQGNDYISFSINDSLNFSVNICYEIIFGHSVAKSVTKNTGAILMIANEQMLSGDAEKNFYTNLCRLRAIESGKYLAKSSNTGFSGLINEKGQTVFNLFENKFGLKNIEIPILKKETFYTKYFHFIHFLIFFQSILVGIFFLVKRIKDLN